jgi:hypothetical protein
MIWSRVRSSSVAPVGEQGVGVAAQGGEADDALLDGEVAGQDAHGVGGGAEPDATVGAFVPAARDVGLAVGLVGEAAGERGGLLQAEVVEPAGEALVDLASRGAVEVAGLSDDGVGDAGGDVAVGQGSVGVGEVGPPGAGGGDAPGGGGGGEAAGEADFFRDAAAGVAGVHVAGELVGDPGLGEADDLRRPGRR